MDEGSVLWSSIGSIGTFEGLVLFTNSSFVICHVLVWESERVLTASRSPAAVAWFYLVLPGSAQVKRSVEGVRMFLSTGIIPSLSLLGRRGIHQAVIAASFIWFLLGLLLSLKSNFEKTLPQLYNTGIEEDVCRVKSEEPREKLPSRIL